MALGFARCDAADGFFAATAQVVPVLLLALAIEARPFGPLAPRRVRHQPKTLTALEWTRAGSTGAILVALGVAEIVSINALVDSGDRAAAWPVYLALVAGLFLVGALAFVGAKARVTMMIRCQPYRDQPDHFLLIVGFGNQFGDRDIVGHVNVLIPSKYEFRVAYHDARVPKDTRTLTTPESIHVKGQPEFQAVTEWRYIHPDVDLPVGEHRLIYRRVSRDQGQTHMPVVARFDNGDLPAGRVELCLNLELPAIAGSAQA